nr:pEARLI1-like lipid transfer protein 1 [Ipomoea batatas]
MVEGVKKENVKEDVEDKKKTRDESVREEVEEKVRNDEKELRRPAVRRFGCGGAPSSDCRPPAAVQRCGGAASSSAGVLRGCGSASDLRDSDDLRGIGGRWRWATGTTGDFGCGYYLWLLPNRVSSSIALFFALNLVLFASVSGCGSCVKSRSRSLHVRRRLLQFQFQFRAPKASCPIDTPEAGSVRRRARLSEGW